MSVDPLVELTFKKKCTEAMIYRLRTQRQFGRNLINLMSFFVLVMSIMLIIYTNVIDKMATDFVSALNIIISIGIIMIGYEIYGEGNDGRIVSAKLFIELCDKIEISSRTDEEKLAHINDHFEHLNIDLFRTDINYVSAIDNRFIHHKVGDATPRRCVLHYKWYKWVNFIRLMFFPFVLCIIVMSAFIYMDKRANPKSENVQSRAVVPLKL